MVSIVIIHITKYKIKMDIKIDDPIIDVSISKDIDGSKWLELEFRDSTISIMMVNEEIDSLIDKLKTLKSWKQ